MSVLAALRSKMVSESWPPKAVASSWEKIELYSALRSSDSTRIKQEASVAWNHP